MKRIILIFAMLVSVSLIVNAQKPVKTPIDIKKLHKNISANITKEHAGYTVVEATKIVEKGVTTTEVIVQNEAGEKVKFIYDKANKFVKEEPIVEEVKKGKKAKKEKEDKGKKESEESKTDDSKSKTE